MRPYAERLKQANTLLAPYAVPSEGTLGRVYEEPIDETRFPFQRDRDRIIHTQAFRRLQGKTQVFVAGEGDHYRTRLTHTMEVTQVSRDLARSLALNEDLAEAIALAHDLGHPPFGHAGEATIDAWMRTHGEKFEHNEQSHRIVTLLEERSSKMPGLNLQREILFGLLKHTPQEEREEAFVTTLEAQIANIADEIAYLGHDCEDALRADLFPLSDLLRIPLVAQAHARSQERGSGLRGSIIHYLIADIIEQAEKEIPRTGASATLRCSDTIQKNIGQLRIFLRDRVYTHPKVYMRAEEGQRILLRLCEHFFLHPTDKILALQARTDCALFVAVKDYVAGMTDTYAHLTVASLPQTPAQADA